MVASTAGTILFPQEPVCHDEAPSGKVSSNLNSHRVISVLLPSRTLKTPHRDLAGNLAPHLGLTWRGHDDGLALVRRS